MRTTKGRPEAYTDLRLFYPVPFSDTPPRPLPKHTPTPQEVPRGLPSWPSSLKVRSVCFLKLSFKKGACGVPTAPTTGGVQLCYWCSPVGDESLWTLPAGLCVSYFLSFWHLGIGVGGG